MSTQHFTRREDANRYSRAVYHVTGAPTVWSYNPSYHGGKGLTYLVNSDHLSEEQADVISELLASGYNCNRITAAMVNNRIVAQ